MSEQILEIKQKDAIKAYTEADSNGKSLLVNLFGKDKLQKLPAIERIKSFEDALEDQGLLKENVLPYKTHSSDTEEALNAMAKMWVIAKSLNEGWEAKLHDTSQYKYYPYFNQSASGSGLSYGDCGDWGAGTVTGVRFAFKNSELAEYAGKQFIDIYSKFII